VGINKPGAKKGNARCGLKPGGGWFPREEALRVINGWGGMGGGGGQRVGGGEEKV